MLKSEYNNNKKPYKNKSQHATPIWTAHKTLKRPPIIFKKIPAPHENPTHAKIMEKEDKLKQMKNVYNAEEKEIELVL